MKREISSGGVVFRKSGKILKILLIKDSYGRWSLPKGLIEKGETMEQTALREISEETGLKKIKIIEKLGDVKYIYTLKGEKIFKIVRFFLVQATDSRLKRSWEVQDVKWFSAEEASEKIEYSNSRPLVKKAIRIIL